MNASYVHRPFGYYLREKRKQLGLSQADVADRAKIQRTSISRLESSSGNPQWSMIRIIAEDGLGISVAELFQVDPEPAREPIIVLEGEIASPKLAELMLKTQALAIPLVDDPTPLRSKVITEKDIRGYCAVDKAVTGEPGNKSKLVGWKSKGKEESWLLVDINDAALEDGGVFLVVLDDGKIEPRLIWISPKGALIMEPIENGEERPVGFWGRQKDRIECLGRALLRTQKCAQS